MGYSSIFQKKKFLEKSQMIWPPASPDLTLIKNRERRRFMLVQSVSGSMKIIKADLWDARYSTAYKNIYFKDIESLTNWTKVLY